MNQNGSNSLASKRGQGADLCQFCEKKCQLTPQNEEEVACGPYLDWTVTLRIGWTRYSGQFKSPQIEKE